MKAWFVAGSLAIMLSVIGCQNRNSPAPKALSQTVAKVAPKTTDQWLGQWDGPEGTFLRLSRDGDKYIVLIQDLDGPKTFNGVEDNGRIRFVRDGKTEYIFAGDGVASGMKWLADKKSCLMTRPGEGWCRN
jgi:hypothetical protein